MEIKQIINHIYTSNTYILSKTDSKDTWLIDAGDTDKVIQWLKENDKILKGIFITHAHFDHIYGLNRIYEYNPQIPIYTSETGKVGLTDTRYNLSLYTGSPFSYVGSCIHILKEDDCIHLWPDTLLRVLETPGHDWSCLSYTINDFLFTGDSYIPGVPLVKNLPRSNKELALASQQRLINYPNVHTICPGHGNILKK